MGSSPRSTPTGINERPERLEGKDGVVPGEQSLQRNRLQVLCAVGEDVDHSSRRGTQPIGLTVERAET
jgi:hypothetical protein